MPKYRYLVLSLGVQVWWVAPGQQPNAHPPTRSLCPGRMERKQKAKRLTDRDNDGLTGKEKAVCTSKAKRGICSLGPIGRQMSRQFLGSRSSARIPIALDDKCL